MAKQLTIQNSDPNKIQASPTKDFFISMLIKDITLRDAIGDLVDNSIDSIKAKSKSKSDFKGSLIEINFNESIFSIKDNGGGIEEKVAREYAFKLGKPIDHKLIDYSIGRFGIGMKRAFFKLGDLITVKSKAPKSSFSITIPVNDWKKDEDNWSFDFDTVKKDQNNEDSHTGTYISITTLSKEARDNFNSIEFENDLKKEIAREQIINIKKGIVIKINGEIISPEPLTIKFNKDIIPSYWKHTFKHEESELNVEIFAGVSDEIEMEGGWNVFCNDRLILSRDTTAITGWTGIGGDGVAKYHQQFWGFRGYVFFSSRKSSSLPWNTTKTGIDHESVDYIVVRKKMIELMKDVILLLNRQKKEREKDNPIKNQILNHKVNSAKSISIIELIKKKKKLTSKFQFPSEINLPKEKDQQTIKYTVPTLDFKRVKKNISASSPSDVGRKTFDYYFENEVEG